MMFAALKLRKTKDNESRYIQRARMPIVRSDSNHDSTDYLSTDDQAKRLETLSNRTPIHFTADITKVSQKRNQQHKHHSSQEKVSNNKEDKEMSNSMHSLI